MPPLPKWTRFFKNVFKRTEKWAKSRKTERVLLTVAAPDCERKTLEFRLFYACKRVFQHFQPKNVYKPIKKGEKMVVSFILEIMCVKMIIVRGYEKNDHFFCFFYGFIHVFRLKMLKHAFKRIKKTKFERFSLTVGNRNCE